MAFFFGKEWSVLVANLVPLLLQAADFPNHFGLSMQSGLNGIGSAFIETIKFQKPQTTFETLSVVSILYSKTTFSGPDIFSIWQAHFPPETTNEVLFF